MYVAYFVVYKIGCLKTKGNQSIWFHEHKDKYGINYLR